MNPAKKSVIVSIGEEGTPWRATLPRRSSTLCFEQFALVVILRPFTTLLVPSLNFRPRLIRLCLEIQLLILLEREEALLDNPVKIVSISL